MKLKNPYKLGGMFNGASYLIFKNAKQLRKNMTAAEMVLWLHLRKGLYGLKFRRQHPIGLFIVDFYCHKVKLVIEIDGSIHNLEDVKENDKLREKELQKWGYSVIRFTNDELLHKCEEVINAITQKILELNNLLKQNTP